MTKAIFIRTISGLVPDDDAAREALHGVPPGALVACEVSRPRNLKHHRLFWKLCSTIGEAVGVHRDAVANVIKLRSGHTITVKTAKGLHEFPKSISFAKMDQGQFSAFFNDACAIVCSEFIPNMKPSQLRDEVLRMAGVPVESEAA